MHCGLLNMEQQDRGHKRYAAVLNNGILQYFGEIFQKRTAERTMCFIICLHHNDSDLASTKLNGKSKSFFFATWGAILFILPRMFDITIRSLSSSM